MIATPEPPDGANVRPLRSAFMVRRWLAGAVVGACLLTACNGGDDAAPSTTFAAPVTNPPLPTNPVTTPSSSSDVPTTSTTVPESSTTPPTTEGETGSTSSTAPPPSSSSTQPQGEPDWVEIIQGLSVVYEELQRDPFSHEINEFCLPGDNECGFGQGAAVEQFRSEGWRALDYPTTPILDARLNATANDLPLAEAPFVVVLVEQGAADFSNSRVVDESGGVVFTIDADGEPGRANWVLARDEMGEWRVVSIMGL